MIRGGYSRVDKDDQNYKFKITTEKLMSICKIEELSEYIKKQQQKYAAHLIRQPDHCPNKRLIYNNDKRKQRGRPITAFYNQAVKNSGLDEEEFMRHAKLRLI